ncbi:putative acetyltransferase [Vibrio ishigakensis]|uniref:Putative acetyltransferase n=1 Tax=Vibrio ishigakensis TaxID=1481914 RepID=A0A0B8PI24_9VIBR|nr:putative acetyltransferase [Vibrio ishigakensis]
MLKFSFTELGLESVYSLTALCNLPSQRVMQKIGMHNLNQDFQHPRLEPDSPLSWHCLYHISRQAWLESNT